MAAAVKEQSIDNFFALDLADRQLLIRAARVMLPALSFRSATLPTTACIDDPYLPDELVHPTICIFFAGALNEENARAIDTARVTWAEVACDKTVPAYLVCGSPFMAFAFYTLPFHLASRIFAGDDLHIRVLRAWITLSPVQKSFWYYLHHEKRWRLDGHVHAWRQRSEKNTRLWSEDESRRYNKRHRVPYIERVDPITAALDKVDLCSVVDGSSQAQPIDVSTLLHCVHRLYMLPCVATTARVKEQKLLDARPDSRVMPPPIRPDSLMRSLVHFTREFLAFGAS